jgi:hypothetical protein
MQTAIAAISQQMTDAGAFVRDTWVGAVSGGTLPGMKKTVDDRNYADAIKLSNESSGGVFSFVVRVDGYPRAEDIERGLPAYDMKPFLLNGPKSRPTKDGNGRYNIIPFRHMTPTRAGGGASAIHLRMQMPKNIYDQAKQLSRSVLNPTTGKVNWEQSLRTNEMGGINKVSLYQHKTNKYEGMYRVGAEKHSQYLTFRAVSTPRTDSKGRHKGSALNSWIHPAIPANPIMQAVYDYCIPRIDENLQELLHVLFA